jgi:hypothetical protein
MEPRYAAGDLESWRRKPLILIPQKLSGQAIFLHQSKKSEHRPARILTVINLW